MINNYSGGYVKVAALVLILCCYIGVSNSVAQRDMILTQAGEELRCRILDETPVRFAFAYLKDGKPYRSEIFKTLVTSFKFNYYDEDLPNANKLPKAMYQPTDDVEPESPRVIVSEAPQADKKSKGKKKKRNTTEDSVNEEGSNMGTQNSTESQSVPMQEVDGSRKLATTSELQRKAVDSPQKAATSKLEESRPDVKSEANQIKEVQTDQLVSDVAKNNPQPKKVIEEKKAIAQNTISATGEQQPIVKEAKPEESAVSVTPTEPDETTDNELSGPKVLQENKFRIGLKGGVGNRLDNNLQTTNSYDLYLDQLLRGWTIGADLAYFPTEAFGFGVVLTDFRSKNSDNEILYRNEFTGAEQVGSIANNRSVKFVGPALFVRKKLDYKTYVILGLSPGYNFYRDNGSYEGNSYTFKGGGFGAASTLGIDFLLGNDVVGRDIILSFEAGYNYGKINALDYSDARGLVDLTTPIDISRLDFTIGLRFIRFPRFFKKPSEY